MYMPVGDIVTQVRALLQDDAGDRWPDTKVYVSLNMGLLETRRLRADIFRNTPDLIQQYTPADAAVFIMYPIQYIPALMFYVAGLIQLQDIEGTQDPRAAALLQSFQQKLQSAGA